MVKTITLSDGCRLNIRFDGNAAAPVLLLSHSLGVGLDMWAPQVGPLSRHFRVLRYDSRGHGASDTTPGPYSMERLGRDVVELIDRLGLDHIHFAGLSMGGMVGQWLGANAPERLSRLVLCSTAAHMPPASTWDARIALVRSQGMAAIVDGVMERWFTARFRQDHADAVAPVAAMLQTTGVDGYTACCAAVRDMDQRALLPAITVPTLVIAGTQDKSTPVENAKEMAAAIPGCKLVELEAAHLSNVEQVEGFNAVLLSFLTA